MPNNSRKDIDLMTPELVEDYAAKQDRIIELLEELLEAVYEDIRRREWTDEEAE